MVAVAIVAFALLGARMLAVFAPRSAGHRPSTHPRPRPSWGWFGPKGVATMTFSLLILSEFSIPDDERIFGLAALAVCASVIAHGLSDEPGAEWIARRSAAADA